MCLSATSIFFFSSSRCSFFFSFAFVCFVISSLFTFFLFLDSVISLNCCRFCDYLKLLSAHLLCFFFLLLVVPLPFLSSATAKQVVMLRICLFPLFLFPDVVVVVFFFLLPLLCSVFSFWCTAFCDHHNSNGNKSKPRHRPSFSTSL